MTRHVLLSFLLLINFVNQISGMQNSPSAISESSNLKEKKEWAENIFKWYVKRKKMLCTFNPITITSIDMKGNVITIEPRNPTVHILMSYPYLTPQNDTASILSAIPDDKFDTTYQLIQKVYNAQRSNSKPSLSIDEMRTLEAIQHQSKSLYKFLNENTKKSVENRFKKMIRITRKSQ